MSVASTSSVTVHSLSFSLCTAYLYLTWPSAPAAARECRWTEWMEHSDYARLKIDPLMYWVQETEGLAHPQSAKLLHFLYSQADIDPQEMIV